MSYYFTSESVSEGHPDKVADQISDGSIAVTVNLLLFGLTAPFAAALMARFGMRAVTSSALVLVGAGAALSIFATAPWVLVLTSLLLLAVTA